MRPFTAAQLSDGVKAVSDDLTEAVVRAVMKDVGPTLKKITRSLDEGDFQEAEALTRELGFTEAVATAEKAARKFSRSAAMVGAGAIDNPKTSLWANGAPFPFEVDESAVKLISNMIVRQLERDTKRRLEDRITRASRFQKAASIDPAKLANDINRYMRGEIRRVVDVSANIVGTRVAAFGSFHEARARGVRRYRIDAVLDERTTEICRHMDGRQFSVEQAYTRTQEVISTTDPVQQKRIAPFPEIDTVKALDSAGLQARGFDVPPFHFLCRSVVTLIDSQTEVAPIPVSVFPDNPKPMTDTQIDGFIADQRPAVRKAFAMKAADDFEDLFDRAFKEVEVNSRDVTLNRAVAAQAYAGNLYFDINASLREHKIWRTEEHRRIAKTLDDTFDDLPVLKEDMIVYRGVGEVPLREMDQIGKVFQDDGFMSTTFNPSLPDQFHRQARRGGGMLQILVPKGEKALSLAEISQLGAENEMLLPRGMQLRVIGIGETVIDGQTVPVVKVVAQGTGRKIDLNNIEDYETQYESILNISPDRYYDKFVYKSGDINEAATA